MLLLNSVRYSVLKSDLERTRYTMVLSPSAGDKQQSTGLARNLSRIFFLKFNFFKAVDPVWVNRFEDLHLQIF